MIVVDVNVLVAAHLSDHSHHEIAFRFLSTALEEDSVVVPDAVWVGFLRIVTNVRIFETPSTLPEALAFVRAVTGADSYRCVPGLIDGLESFLRMVGESDAMANLVPDAYIAAIAVAHSCPVATFDRDFGRFPGVQVVTPD